MKTEPEKCLSGEWYDCHAPVFIKFKTKTHKLLLEHNALAPRNQREKVFYTKRYVREYWKRCFDRQFICM